MVRWMGEWVDGWDIQRLNCTGLFKSNRGNKEADYLVLSNWSGMHKIYISGHFIGRGQKKRKED